MIGGEPLLRRDLLRLLAAIRASGNVPGLVTTGAALSYPQVRASLRRAGLSYLRLQLFGVGADHDRATAVPGSFQQAMAGLRSWVGESEAACDVDVSLSSRGRSPSAVAEDIAPLSREVGTLGAQIVVAVDPDASAEGADPATWLESMHTVAGWNDDPSRPLLAWEGLPTLSSPIGHLCIHPLPPRFAAAVPAACCIGSVRAMSFPGSAPHGETYANSFNYVRTDVSVPLSPGAETCTAHREAQSASSERALWLVEEDRLALFSSDTGDFDGATIDRIKNELSHLFIDLAAPGRLDDFTEGMRRVLPDDTCNTCVHRTACARRFRVVPGPPYDREETWIAAYVAALSGDVLDVGCGEQLYRREIAPLVGSGVVRYTGLDPDAVSLASARAAIPEGRYQLGGIEDFSDTPASYDHILCLRSLNHVADMDEAMARMSELLRPGGRLLVVECTPFAMLRRHEQVSAADRAPRAGHQHLRNVSGEEVIPLARRRSLRVLHHHPVSRGNTNEWILLLERSGPAAAAGGNLTRG